MRGCGTVADASKFVIGPNYLSCPVFFVALHWRCVAHCTIAREFYYTVGKTIWCKTKETNRDEKILAINQYRIGKLSTKSNVVELIDFAIM
jgi:hypothetical protein